MVLSIQNRSPPSQRRGWKSTFFGKEQYSEATLPLQNFFFPILGSFETLNQLGDCYPNPSTVLSEPVSSGAAFVRSTKVFKKFIK